MSDHNVSWFQGARKFWFIGVALASTILWAVEGPLFLKHPHWQLFLRETAFALLIACIYGLTIEQVQRSEFIRLVTQERENLKRDVFLYAYGYNVPDQIREEIRKNALINYFYRRNLVLDWEFSPPDADGMMPVKKRYSYSLVNSSSDPKEWVFTFVQIGADDQKAVAEGTLDVLRIRRGTELQEFKGASLETETSGQAHMRKFTKVISLAPQEQVDIHYDVRQVRRSFGDDKYNCRDAVVGVTKVKIRFPLGHKFAASVHCKTKPLTVAPDSDPPALYSFEFDEGLFPYQGIVVSWSNSEVKESEPQKGEQHT